MMRGCTEFQMTREKIIENTGKTWHKFRVKCPLRNILHMLFSCLVSYCFKMKLWILFKLINYFGCISSTTFGGALGLWSKSSFVAEGTRWGRTGHSNKI